MMEFVVYPHTTKGNSLYQTLVKAPSLLFIYLISIAKWKLLFLEVILRLHDLVCSSH